MYRFFAVVCTAGLCFGTGARADDLSCRPVRDAMPAKTAVKFDDSIVTTQPGRKPIIGADVYTLDAMYHQVLERWIKTPTSPKQEFNGEKDIDATFSDCRHLGDATLNGEPVTIYTARMQNRTVIPFTGDLKLWVSRKRGVPLRSEANASIPLLGSSHTVKTYSYDNVRPPN